MPFAGDCGESVTSAIGAAFVGAMGVTGSSGPGIALKGEGMAAGWTAMKESWVTFFQKPQIWMMLAVIFFYRFGEGFIEKFGPLFLLDARDAGGLVSFRR